MSLHSPTEVLPIGVKRIWIPTLVFIVVGLDFFLARHVWDEFLARAAIRCLLALSGVVILARIGQLDLLSLGFTLRVRRGWKFWSKLGIGALGTIGILIMAYWVISQPLGLKRPDIFWKFKSQAGFWTWWLPTGGFVNPFVEELIYRVFLITALRFYFRPALTIFLSGLVFAVLHVAYGAAAPENIIGGFLLSWAYLESESIAVPLLFHMGGNIAAGITHIPF